MSKKFVNPRYAKTEEYLKDLMEINEAGKCPFCPRNLNWHKKPILREVGGWFITETMRPYENSKHHFLIIGPEHKESFEELSTDDFEKIRGLVKWARASYSIPGYGLSLRSDDAEYTGATVKHIHLHLIVPEKGRVVNFPFG